VKGVSPPGSASRFFRSERWRYSRALAGQGGRN